MDVLETILMRRSIRKYSDEPVPEEKLHRILQAGLMAPSSRNKKPCEFYIIQNSGVLKKLSKAKKAGAGMLSSCSAAIVVAANSQTSDTWIEDSSIALSYMNLEAAEEGIGSCWCQIHLRSSLLGKDAEDNVREILDIRDKNMRIVGILALGMPASEEKPHTMEEADWKKVHEIS